MGTCVNFTFTNKIQAMHERSLVSIKVEQGSTFTFTGDLSYIASISFTRVKFTCVRTEKLRDGGNLSNGLISPVSCRVIFARVHA